MNCPFGCSAQIVVPPKYSTCNLKNLHAHFKTAACSAVDYGFKLDIEKTEKQKEQSNKRRRDRLNEVSSQMAPLLIQAPRSVHDALKLIAQQSEETILEIAANLKNFKID